MAEEVFVEIKGRAHLADVWRWIGISDVQQKLSEVPAAHRVPGFALASAVLDREAAEARTAVVMANLHAIAKAGVDVAAVQSVHLEGGRSDIRLKVTMMDLADLAAEGGDGAV